MKFKTKVVTSLIALLLCFVLVFITVGSTKANVAVTRTITINDNTAEYSAFFNEFENAELLLDANEDTIKFTGTKTIDASIFEDVDLISLSDNEKGVDVKYSFDYNADKNEFLLSVIADTEDGEIIDNWFGVPFTTDGGDVDISFATEDGIIYLSELQESGVLENCGWFSKILKKIAKVAVIVAAVAVVVAVVAVAAPAVATAGAAITAGTTIAVGGGTAALAGTAATVAVATAATTAIASTAAIATCTAVAAATVAVTSYLGAKVFESLEEKVKAATIELSKIKKYEGTLIYRAHTAGTYYESLTPRASDMTGMSFFDGIPLLFGALTVTKGVFITTVEMARGEGFTMTKRSTVIKGFTGNHYDLGCSDGTYKSWQASMSAAKKGNPHFNTLKLAGIVYYVGNDYSGAIN